MRKRFLSFEVKKNYEHIIGEVDGHYLDSFYELLEALNHQDMANDEQIETIEALIDGGSPVIGDYQVSIDIEDVTTVNQLKETIEELKREIEED